MAQLQAARKQIERANAAGTTADRSVRSLMFDSGSVGVHPMMRHVAAAVSAGACSWEATANNWLTCALAQSPWGSGPK